MVFSASVVCPDAAAEATQGVPRSVLSAPMSLRLEGDEGATAIVPLWETDLDNLDSFQDNVSMAVAGDVVCVCVNYLDPIETGEDRSSIFIRRFNAADGSELQPWVIACPDDYRLRQKTDTGYKVSDRHNITIGSDSHGNLLLACYRCRESANPQPVLTLVPLSPDGELLTRRQVDVDGQYNSNGNFYFRGNSLDQCSVSISDAIDGDISSGDYTVWLTLGVDTQPEYYDYTRVTVTDDTPDYPNFNRLNFGLLPEMNDAAMKRPQLHRVAGQERYFTLTLCQDYDKGTPPGAPRLFRCPGSSTDINYAGCTMSLDQLIFPAAPLPQRPCMGFHTFLHGGHVMAVYPRHLDKQEGVRFTLAEWPDMTSFATLAGNFTILPENPFAYPTKMNNPGYRQMAVSRTVDSDQVTGWERPAGDTTPVTDMFICSPGSGIAAYRLTAPNHTTALSETAIGDRHSAPSLRLRGNMLYADPTTDPAAAITLTDTRGRTVYRGQPQQRQLTLDRFAPGIYIATFANSRLKIAIH